LESIEFPIIDEGERMFRFYEGGETNQANQQRTRRKPEFLLNFNYDPGKIRTIGKNAESRVFRPLIPLAFSL
jgi:hypothetical protein